MNRYVDLRDVCSNTFFTTGSLFSLDSAACGGSCRHGRCVGVISVSLCKQEMTVKDGIISWSVMNDVTVGNNEKDRKRGNERFSMCATSIFWRYESKVVTRIFSERAELNKYESFLRILYLHRYCVVLYWTGFINGMTVVLFTVSQPQTTFLPSVGKSFSQNQSILMNAT